jgi:hypothetical protein
MEKDLSLSSAQELLVEGALGSLINGFLPAILPVIAAKWQQKMRMRTGRETQPIDML